MKINRLKYSIARHPIKLVTMSLKMNHYSKDKYDIERSYQEVRTSIKTILEKGKVTVNAYGLENINNLDNYIMLANHQGKADTLAVINTHEKPCSVVIDKTVCTNPFLNSCLNCMHAKKLDKTNPRQGLMIFNQIKQEVIRDKRTFLIFPEGQHTGNMNNLQEFNTGCLGFIYDTMVPIVPICLYNTYQVYEVKDTKPVSCEIHYLKPIYFDEYKNLRKKELASLVKERIQAKLDEIKLNETLN